MTLTNTLRRIALVAAGLLCSLTMSSVPANPAAFTVQQPDGTRLTLRLEGDEHCRYYRNIATGEAMTLTPDGRYVTLPAATLALRSERAALRRAASDRRRMARSVVRPVASPGASTPDSRRCRATMLGQPYVGQKRGLVILINFSDKRFAASHTRSTFDDYFNREGYDGDGNIGSVHDYFYDQSYGQFDLCFDVVGPVTLSRPMSYYGRNNVYGYDDHPGEMVIEACRMVHEQGVNFADYDWDGDGEVDQVFVIYAGYGENHNAPTTTIWPHEWTLTDAYNDYADGEGPIMLDGVTIDTYACSSELYGKTGTTLCGIGTACHEFSHCLGLPDFYNTAVSGGSYGMSYFDLMHYGSYSGPLGIGEVPCGYSAYERWMAGWLVPQPIVGPTTVEAMPSIADAPVAYIMVNPANPDEYLLIEHRVCDRWFAWISAFEAGHGLFVVHVDYDDDAWYDNTVNNDTSHQRMSIVPANGVKGSTSAQCRAMYFPGPNGVTSLTPSSHMRCGGMWFSPEGYIGHHLTHITETDDFISFVVDGGVPDGTLLAGVE